MGGWNEVKNFQESNDIKIQEAIKKAKEGFLIRVNSMNPDAFDIRPLGLYTQLVNGMNYRILCAVKEKTSSTPTLYDVSFHKSNSEIKMIYAKNPEHSETNLSEKDKKYFNNNIINNINIIPIPKIIP